MTYDEEKGPSRDINIVRREMTGKMVKVNRERKSNIK